ncbi:hypothetical protein F5Y00DRAFT_228780 [Daldinia vernicosa]|uniref:uncharacterized protein n=1 Tax=Daldinia vernicosa TaxID=114800 RepID=UPI002007A094|nr:uncharacterized protein F5Y00DRAFT_228780 [Daldinia vernicosa]KAI0852151.1 hypothetical protein F5Y00DRAFT_228780 [Daldinia vernicosa]
MAEMSYTEMRTLVGTRLQWLADIGENNRGINGGMVLEWIDTVLEKMSMLEDYLQKKKESLKAKRAEEKKIVQDSKLQLERNRTDLVEMWDTVQHQAQEINGRALKQGDLTRRTTRKIARLECEVIRQSEEAERLSRLLQISESTAAARQDALSKTVARLRGLRSQTRKAFVTATRNLEVANKKVNEADTQLRGQLQLQKESHESIVRSLESTSMDEVKRLRELLEREQEASKRSQHKAEQEHAEIERLRGLLEDEKKANASTSRTLQVEREVAKKAATKAGEVYASLIGERNPKRLKEAESRTGETNAEVQILKSMIVEDRTKRQIREVDANPGRWMGLPLLLNHQTNAPGGPPDGNGVISWPNVPGPLAERLRRFRPKVSAPSTMSAEDITNIFIKVCEQEVVAVRLSQMLSGVQVAGWYCFDHVCQYGIHDDRSKASGGSCTHHQSCLLIRRPLVQGDYNILCRGVRQSAARPT